MGITLTLGALPVININLHSKLDRETATMKVYEGNDRSNGRGGQIGQIQRALPPVRLSEPLFRRTAASRQLWKTNRGPPSGNPKCCRSPRNLPCIAAGPPQICIPPLSSISRWQWRRALTVSRECTCSVALADTPKIDPSRRQHQCPVRELAFQTSNPLRICSSEMPPRRSCLEEN